MKTLNFKIPNTAEETFRIQEDRLPHFYENLHQHNEIQITLIVKGRGTLLVEDFVGNIKPGDVYVIGSNSSHLFKSLEKDFTSDQENIHTISIFFEPHFLGDTFLKLPETHELQEFIKLTYKGLKAGKSLSNKISILMHQLAVAEGFKKMVLLFEVLEILCSAKDYELLSKAIPQQVEAPTRETRLNNVFQFTMTEYASEIHLPQVADIANMTVSAFCKYFKQHTAKTYFQFLNEIRVSNACKLLRENSISIERVAYEVGFNNLSNFNRKFKQINGMTPSAFRKNYTH
ncbi:MAG: AraC family transcriptional regulator [Schleiferiaceae bacterium]|jgi:AraC-like DNA-binding protein|nr:AraC family transcriptional regulator [Schleiferiaceae bacterium]